MSGPGLLQKETHHAIHQAAFGEAEQLTRLLRSLVNQDDVGRAKQVCDVLQEHWQTRTLAHAEAEEDGLYQDIARETPEKAPLIHQLQRDHAVMRQLLQEIAGLLADKGWTSGIVERFEAMLLVNAIHSRDEETFLFASEQVEHHADVHEGGTRHG